MQIRIFVCNLSCEQNLTLFHKEVNSWLNGMEEKYANFEIQKMEQTVDKFGELIVSFLYTYEDKEE